MAGAGLVDFCPAKNFAILLALKRKMTMIRSHGRTRRVTSRESPLMKGSPMLAQSRLVIAGLLTAALLAGRSRAADLTESLKTGTPDSKSVGPLAFGPDGVLFVGDRQAAAIFAIDTGDRT